MKKAKKGRVAFSVEPDQDQLVLGSGMGKRPELAPRGGANPRNFCRLVRMLMEQRK